MSDPAFTVSLADYAKKTEDYLFTHLPQDGDITVRAMLYSLRAGGKRIRPALTLAFCRLCGGNIQDALPLAAALEMIHTYSLIHDDLPCMDDDDMRRGKPSCHKQFGEAYALLAGDGLLTYAFYLIADSEFARRDAAGALEAIRLLSDSAGVNGMIGGQTLDLLHENETADEQMLLKTDDLKTGKLIKAAALLGCIAAGADEKKKAAAQQYSECLGLAFQVVDDILDVEGDEAAFGKPIGSDAQSGKSTYVTVLGTDKAKEFARSLTDRAATALEIFGADADFLRQLSVSLLNRKN